MIDLGKKNVIGVCVNAIDYEAAIAQIVVKAQDHQPMAVTALAVHGIMTGVQDDEHRYRLNQFDLVVPDGQPVRWAMNWLYQTKLQDRVYGPTLTWKLCERAEKDKIPIYFYGSRQHVLEKLTKNLKQHFPQIIIAGTQPSKFRQTTPEEKHTIAEDIRNSGAQITFVGLGCPRQEVWVYEYHELLYMPAIAVGAAFDFIAETVPQAPAWMQKRGLEWFFRLVQEPKRLWQRYLLLNPAYLTLLTMQKLGIREFNTETTAPSKEILYG